MISKHGHKFQCDAVYANELVDRQTGVERKSKVYNVNVPFSEFRYN